MGENGVTSACIRDHPSKSIDVQLKVQPTNLKGLPCSILSGLTMFWFGAKPDARTISE